MSKLLKMDKSGHSTAAQWRADHPNEVKSAKEVFNDLKDRKYGLFTQGDNPRKLDQFDASAEEIVAVAPLVGG